MGCAVKKIWRLALSVFFLLFSGIAASPVYACSGGLPTPLVTLLEESTIVVHARVLDTDEFGQTGVVEVIEYLVGQADANRLLVVQSDPVRTTYLLEGRRGPGGCSMTATPFQVDEEVYLFLALNDDNTYRLATEPDQFNWGTLTYRFPAPESTALLITGRPFSSDAPDIPGTLESQQVNEAEFRRILLEYARSSPSYPSTDSPYPLPASILLTTTEATYILYPDHSDPRLIEAEELASLRRSQSVWRRNDPIGVTGCAEVGCTAYSPNGIESASVISEGVWQAFVGLVPGEGFLYSNTNELIVVWNGDQLDFYQFPYPNLEVDDISRNGPEISISINGGSAWAGRAAWSMDGRLLAYTDAEGLWLLDVYSQFKRLLLPATEEDSPARARYFSENGRYLAVTIGQTDERYNLDLVTGQRLPDGIFSPNERFLLAYDTAEPRSMYSRCIIASQYPCREIGLGGDSTWIDNNLAVITDCESNAAYLSSCWNRFGLSSHHCCIESLVDGASGFDFTPITDSYVVIQSPYEIAVEDGHRTVIRDLRGNIQGEILTVEWLPSLYNIGRTFSETAVQLQLQQTFLYSAEEGF